ncbi:MAG: GAF domain-containing protein [Chloroflexi bacterium]|nr:GAF domain-containing protein [Chloroflexota bacterium]
MTVRLESRGAYADMLPGYERWAELVSKCSLLLLGIISTGFLQRYRYTLPLTCGVAIYALSTVAYLFFVAPRAIRRSQRNVYFVSYALDIAFASQMIYYSAEFSSEVYLPYALLALKSAIYYPLWPEVLVFLFALGPLYVLISRLAVGGWYFLTDTSFLLRYAALSAVVLGALYLGWLNERSHLRESNLRRSLAQRTLELDNKTRSTQQMATDLGNRVLELRTLQEGIKAISSALALEDVLRLIVANASQVLEGARCSVVLLGAAHDEMVSMASADGTVQVPSTSDFRYDRQIAEWVVQQGKPVQSSDVRQEERFERAIDAKVSALIGVPLFLGNESIGALIATSPLRNAFSSDALSLLNAFADQAAVAVSKARLYERLVQEQKQTEQLYQHVEERRNELEAILRGIGDGVIVTDPDLNLLLMNPVATRIFGVRSDVTSSMPLLEVIPHQELYALFQDALHSEEQAIVREIPVVSDNIAATYQALASPILGVAGKVRGVVTVFRDVTSQKELERMKSSFLSVVSHELKTPLHSIKGFVDIILMGKTGPITETQSDFLTTVRDQTAHLQNLINDLLEFSRLESGQIKLNLAEVSMGEVAKAVVDKLKPLADQGQVRMVNRVDVDAPAIEADHLRIEQVLTNLVHNAIKFTSPAGTVTISLEDLGEEVQVAVSDTGIGIPAGEMTRIFDRFYQVDASSTRHYRGTGLGLTICKHIIEYHHGRIWVESEEGKGSTFLFVLPKRMVGREEPLLLDFLSLPQKGQG